MRIVTPTSIIFFSLLLAGCAAIQGLPDRSFTREDDLAALKKYNTSVALEKYDLPNDSDRGNMSREAWRNLVLEARVQDVNLHFADFEEALYKQGVGFGIGTDWLILALSGGAAVASQGVANALAAATAGIAGARTAVDKEALYNKTLVALMAQMVASRQTALVSIRQGELQTAAAYPLTRGLADLQAYYDAGTIPGALIGVAANSGEQAKKAETILEKLPMVGLVDSNIQALKEPLAACVKDSKRLSDTDAATVVKAKAFTDLTKAMDLKTSDANPKVEILYAIGSARTVDQVNAILALTRCR